MFLNIQDYTKALEITENGVFFNKEINNISYPDEGSDLCFAAEDSSFWFKHRKKCILEIVKQFPPINKGPIFDIGGGNGYMTKSFLEEGYKSVLVEPSKQGIYNARVKRGIKNLIQTSLENANFVKESLPAVSAFDVIEHVADDKKFIQEIYAYLKNEGKFYLTVPAYNWLWSSTDDGGGHYRRYTCSRLEKLLKAAGFKIEFSTYIFSLLPAPIFFLRSIPYRLLKNKFKLTIEQDLKAHKPNASNLMLLFDKLLSWEIKKIKNNQKLFFGGSCLICATKPC